MKVVGGAGSQLQTDATKTLERLRLLPGGPEVLQLAKQREDVELVGGAVRDLMLGHAPREIDVILDGAPSSFSHSAALFARELAERLDGEAQLSVHERFGTASVRWHGQRIDVAARRREHYPAPGALPEVCPGSEEEDLARRDFTVNAIAIGLGGRALGRLRHVERAIEDLRSGRLRVLHDESFLDDPTRLLRLARYAARLGFAVEERTDRLAKSALAAGALDTVSGPRIGAGLRLATSESDPVAALCELRRIGVLEALHPALRLDEQTLKAALEALPSDGRPDLLAIASVMSPLGASDAPTGGATEALTGGAAEALTGGATEAFALLERWEYPAADRDVALEAALRAPLLATKIRQATSSSQLWDLLCRTPPEAVALAGAIGARQGDPAPLRAARLWLTELRHVRLRIRGEDLLGAGLKPGPEIGARLEAVLRLRLDGMIEDGREAELSAAMAAVRR